MTPSGVGRPVADDVRASLQALAREHGWSPRDSRIDPESWTATRGEAVLQIWHHRYTTTVTGRLSAPGTVLDLNGDGIRAELTRDEDPR